MQLASSCYMTLFANKSQTYIGVVYLTSFREMATVGRASLYDQRVVPTRREMKQLSVYASLL